MIVGTLLLMGALFSSFFSAVFSIINNLAFSRRLFRIAILLLFFGQCFLLFLIVHSDMSILYVVKNSSAETPLIYKISALWAGQEGSILLWVFLTGIALAPWKTSVNRSFLAGSSIFLFLLVLTLILWANPYFLAPSGVNAGQGLNMLLQNPWMAVHPPFLFLGYAFAAKVYFKALTLSIKKISVLDLNEIRSGLLLSGGFLTLGIVTGAIWAYQTLGWGGFWGWDPVENGSFIAWLCLSAALHRRSGTNKDGLLSSIEEKANPCIAINALDKISLFLPFILILLFTFLTRGGLFSDISVHSFSSSPLAIPFAVIFILSIVIPLALLLRTHIQGNSTQSQKTTESSVYLMLIYLVIISAGTLFPLLVKLISGSVVTLKSEFFTTISIVFASVFFMIISYTVFDRFGIIRKIITICAALLFIFPVFYYVPHNLWLWILGVSSCCALASALGSGLNSVFRNIAHAGLALLVLGSIASVLCAEVFTVEMPQGKRIVQEENSFLFEGISRDIHGETINIRYGSGNSDRSLLFTVSAGEKDSSVTPSHMILHHLLYDIQIIPGALYEGGRKNIAGTVPVLSVMIIRKPLINMVWFGMLLLSISFFGKVFFLWKRDYD